VTDLTAVGTSPPPHHHPHDTAPLCDLEKGPCNPAGSACVKLSAEATNYTYRCTPPYIGADSATGDLCGKLAIYTETPADGRRGSM